MSILTGPVIPAKALITLKSVSANSVVLIKRAPFLVNLRWRLSILQRVSEKEFAPQPKTFQIKLSSQFDQI